MIGNKMFECCVTGENKRNKLCLISIVWGKNVIEAFPISKLLIYITILFVAEGIWLYFGRC